MKINCILADDEPLARTILTTYINDHPGLELTGTCKDTFETQQLLNEAHCDLLFLDINMPQVSGISLLKSLSNPPLVIFTTAYPDFAVEGYELNAVDYLLKPFSFERFLKAVNKASTLLKKVAIPEQLTPVDDYLFFKVDKKLKKITLAEIRYFEAIGDYVKLYTTQEVLVLSESLRSILEKLPDQVFFRIHKSYIISLGHVQHVEGNYLRTGNTDLPIGAAYKEEFLQRLQDRNRRKTR